MASDGPPYGGPDGGQNSKSVRRMPHGYRRALRGLPD